MLESLNPYVKVYELKFERKMGRGDEAVVYGVPDATIVVFHDNQSDEVLFGQSLIVKAGSARSAPPAAYKVMNALPPVPLDGEFESADPAYKFPIRAQLVVGVSDSTRYITQVSKPFDILQQIVGRTIIGVTRRHQLKDYDKISEALERALVAADTTRTFLHIHQAIVDVKLDPEHERFLQEQRNIAVQQALTEARGKSREEVLTDLTNMLELVQRLRLRMDDLGIQDALLDGLRAGIEGNIQQLLGGGTPSRRQAAAPPALQANIRVQREETPRKLETLGGKTDDFSTDSIPVPPANPAPSTDEDDMFFDDDPKA